MSWDVDGVDERFPIFSSGILDVRDLSDMDWGPDHEQAVYSACIHHTSITLGQGAAHVHYYSKALATLTRVDCTAPGAAFTC